MLQYSALRASHAQCQEGITKRDLIGLFPGDMSPTSVVTSTPLQSDAVGRPAGLPPEWQRSRQKQAQLRQRKTRAELTEMGMRAELAMIASKSPQHAQRVWVLAQEATIYQSIK